MDTMVNGNVDDLDIKESTKADLKNSLKAKLNDLKEKHGDDLMNLIFEFAEIDGFQFNISATNMSKGFKKDSNVDTKSNEPQKQNILTPADKANRWFNGLMKSLQNLLQKFDDADAMLPHINQKKQKYLASNLEHLIESAQSVLKNIK